MSFAEVKRNLQAGQVLLLLNVQAAEMERAQEGKEKKKSADRDALKAQHIGAELPGSLQERE